MAYGTVNVGSQKFNTSAYVPITRKVNGKALSADITLNASDVGAAASGHTHSGYVPTTRKVNNKALSADISLTASDVGAAASGHTHSNYVPTTRKVNGKALSADITLGASDIGAAPTSHSHSNYLMTSQKGAANGVASLGADGKVPASQLSSTGGLMPQIVVTCPSGSTVTCKGGTTNLTATSNGTATFTLPNYGTYTITATINGTPVSRPVVVDAVKQYDVRPFYDKLSDNSWEQISTASEIGIAQDLWNIGDTIDFVVNGETLTIAIMDFKHDDLADGSGKAGITFGLKELMPTTRWSMNDSYSSSNTGGLKNLSIQKNLENLLEAFPTDVKSVIKGVSKKTSAGGGSSTINTDNLQIFLFSEIEVMGTATYSYSGEGSHYPYFATAESRHKVSYRNGDTNNEMQADMWWLRSPAKDSNTSFCYMQPVYDEPRTMTPSNLAGVCFGFCV